MATKKLSNQKIDDKYREPGTIRDVYYGVEDHGIRTVWIHINYDAGAAQGFGGLMLGNSKTDDKLAKQFINDLCRTFGVSSIEQLKGQRCFALKCFGGFNESIEGLETAFGSKFVRTSWWRKNVGKSQSPLEREIEGLERDIERAKETIARSKQELKTIKTTYKDWTK
jgi:hypothetical protein